MLEEQPTYTQKVFYKILAVRTECTGIKPKQPAKPERATLPQRMHCYLGGVAPELLAQRERGCILRVRPPDLDYALPFLRLGGQSVVQFP